MQILFEFKLFCDLICFILFYFISVVLYYNISLRHALNMLRIFKFPDIEERMVLSLLLFRTFLIFLHNFISMSVWFLLWFYIFIISHYSVSTLFSAVLFCVYLPALFYGHPYFVPASLFNILHFPVLFNDHVYSFLAPIFHISHIPAQAFFCFSNLYMLSCK
jgi:hypothetical protein